MPTIIKQKLTTFLKTIIVKIKNFTQLLKICEQIATLFTLLLTQTPKPI